MGFLSLNAYSRHTFTPYWKENREILLHPFSLDSHIAVAQKMWQIGNWYEAKNTLLFANTLVPKPVGQEKNNVLGTTSAPLDILNLWESQPAKLAQEKEYWLGVIAQKPDYRDGFIQLAAIHYQLNNLEKATQYLDSARVLDPNSIVVLRLSQLLSDGK